MIARDDEPATTPAGRARRSRAAVGVAAVLASAALLAGGAPADPVADQIAASGRVVRPIDVYDPVVAGEEMPHGYIQVVARDLIRPVYRPEFVAAAAAGWPDDADVIGVARGDEAKAYPVSHLNAREMVIDEIGGVPIVVTWCPLCGTAMVHERVVDGEPIVFGVQGGLLHNAMTWWDHRTGSVWSQPLGEAVAGPLTGRTVDLLPGQLTSWDAWRSAHPDTLALDAPAAATGFDLDDLYIVVDFTTEVRAYPWVVVRDLGVVNDTVADVDLAVVTDPDRPEGWKVFARKVDDVVVELEVDDGVLRDRVTGSTFHAGRGIGSSGPLDGQVLAQLPAATSLPGRGPMRAPIFDAFWPAGTVWSP